MITRTVDLGKATVILACALSVGTVGGSVVEAQTISESEPTVKSVCQEREAEVVIEPSVFEQQKAEKAERLSRKFQQLAQQWRDERGATSSVAQMAMLSSYQQIIGMGPEAIPMILAQLKSEGNSPNHWFWALASITRDNPVPQNSRGKLQEMAKAWLEWGKKEGYV